MIIIGTDKVSRNLHYFHYDLDAQDKAQIPSLIGKGQ